MPWSRRERLDEDYDVQTEHTRSWDASIVFRILAAIAAGVMTVIGLIAVARVSWGDNGFDAPPVDVAGMMFTPEVAVTTAAAGLIALIAAALYDRTSKLIVGGLLVCAGIVGLLVDPTDNVNWFFEDGHAWLAIGVGATLIVVALLMQTVWTADRHVRHSRPVAS